MAERSPEMALCRTGVGHGISELGPLVQMIQLLINWLRECTGSNMIKIREQVCEVPQSFSQVAFQKSAEGLL